MLRNQHYTALPIHQLLHSLYPLFCEVSWVLDNGRLRKMIHPQLSTQSCLYWILQPVFSLRAAQVYACKSRYSESSVMAWLINKIRCTADSLKMSPVMDFLHIHNISHWILLFSRPHNQSESGRNPYNHISIEPVDTSWQQVCIVTFRVQWKEPWCLLFPCILYDTFWHYVR